ncbi:MAG TPA: Gfo/Idh/MocA family oxidoreductase [Devosia sp.]|jgi:predicted dehydrogenase|nr:Gfo/Idh/MocA family oxidoreductase [Devosia sp.]
MIDSPLGLGVIGCGWAAGEIARATKQLPALRIAAACDADPDRARAFAANTHARFASDIDDLLADPAVSIVYVGLPHYLLSRTVERALGAGKHVLAEKPMALDAEDARRLGEFAASKSLKLAVFFELRRSGTVTAAKRLLEAGEIGEPRLVRLRTIIDKRADYWGPPGVPNWRSSLEQAGGGVLLMNTVHQLDTVRYITGLGYVSATGEIATFRAVADVEDAGSATLRLTNGGIVNIVASAHSPGANYDETIEIDGTLGRIDLPDPFGVGPLRIYRSESQVWNEVAVERPDSHLLMLDSFVGAVVKNEPEPAGAADAAAAIGAVNAIYRSVRERRTIDIG